MAGTVNSVPLLSLMGGKVNSAKKARLRVDGVSGFMVLENGWEKWG